VTTTVQPRPLSTRSKGILAGVAVVVLLCMLVVSLAYRQEGGSVVDGGFDGPGSGIVTRIQPVSMNPNTNTLTVRLVFQGLGQDYFNSSERLNETVWVSVDGLAGTREFRFAQGSKLSQSVIELGAVGDESQYPFDSYLAEFSVSADIMARQSDGSFSVVGSVPVGIAGSGGIPGWDIAMSLPTGLGAETSRGELSLDRAFSTQIFALLILTAVTVLSVIAMVLAFFVATRRLAIEGVLLPWMASMLFALPILRNSMPNAPPIGIALDVYVFFWVLLTSVVAASLIAIEWIKVRWDEASPPVE
jgi:hypothetical protein